MAEGRYNYIHYYTWYYMEVNGKLPSPANSTPPPGKISWYPVDRRAGGLQNQFGYGGQYKNPCDCWELNPSSMVVQSID
jgi:hypothetical protein